MALSADVVVVGSGMAGACAALAAREKGADVLLVARAPGATALSSGAIDFGGNAQDATVGDGARLLAHKAGHPYALFGDSLPTVLERTMAFLRRHLASLALDGARMAADKCLWLPTPVGTARPAALVPSPIAAADLRNLSSRPVRLGVVAFAGAQQIEAGLAAAGLTRLLAPLGEAVCAAIDLYRTREDALRTIPELARDLDRPGRRDLFAASLLRAANAVRATHLLVPTLGLSNPVAMRAQLERTVGRPVFEALGAPPSVPGLRLQAALANALRAAGVRRMDGIAERSTDGAVQVVQGVDCYTVRAGAVVLASGRFIGGGIRSESGSGLLHETVFDLPAFAAGRRSIAALPSEELFAVKASGQHPGMAAGIRVGADLRPLDASATDAALFACGTVIGGFDPSRDTGGLGTCALTGLVAGERAAQAASRAGTSAAAEAIG
ncbi:MAG: FAD-binding protein [Myxococcales bacterium]